MNTLIDERSQRKVKCNAICFKFTVMDDEIIDYNLLQLSDNPETWLYKSQNYSGNKSTEDDYYGSCSNLAQNVGAIDSSCRQFDSRTYTRRKPCPLQPSFESCLEMDSSNNSPLPVNRTARSSLGLCSLSLYHDTSDFLVAPRAMTPPKLPLEISSLDSTGFEEPVPKRFTLDLSILSPVVPIKLHNPFKSSDTSDKSNVDNILEVGMPSINNLTFNASNHNETTNTNINLENPTEFTNVVVNNFTNLNDDISQTYETENIAPAINLNTTLSINKPNLTKTGFDLNSTMTISPNKTKKVIPNGTITKSSYKAPLNTTFPKPTSNSIFLKTLNNTFTRSVDALSGGTEDDQISSASDSSYSSCSNIPRSVDDLHTIARLQEESLEERNTTPKSNDSVNKSVVNGDVQMSTPKSRYINSIDDSVFFDEPLSPIATLPDVNPLTNLLPVADNKSTTTYDKETNATFLRTGVQGVCNPVGATAAVTTSMMPKVSRLKRPTVVSHLPVSRLTRLPAVNSTFIRPPSVPATSIPRPASRLPAPRFRGRTLPK